MRHHLAPARQRGLTLLHVVLIVGGIALVTVWVVQKARGSGGEPLQITLSPDPLALVPDTPATVTARMALTGPLGAGLTFIHMVRVDENDNVDDTLYSDVPVTRSPGEPQGTGTFQLECKNLKADGRFDLHASPTGGSSSDEKNHMVHAEYRQVGPNIVSNEITVSCAAPPVG